MKLALTKKDCTSFINNELQVLLWIIAPAISKILWHLTFMLIFRFNVLSSLKTGKICKMNVCLHNLFKYWVWKCLSCPRYIKLCQESQGGCVLVKFCLIIDQQINLSIYEMNASSITVLTRELKPLDASFLSIGDPCFSWQSYEFLKLFEDWLTRIDVRPVRKIWQKIMFKSLYILS